MTKILGISDAITDSGVCYCENNKVMFAVNEERFTRKKIQGGFPYKSLDFFVEKYKKDAKEIEKIVFAGILTPTIFTRLSRKIEGVDKYKKKESRVYRAVWDFLEYGVKINTRFKSSGKFAKVAKKISERALRRKLPPIFREKKIEFTNHHFAHIASAFYSSPFERALVMSLDGFGDGFSGKIYHYKDNELKELWNVDALDSLGLFYSLVTVFLGYKEHKHEGKITGLSGFGSVKNIKEDFPFVLDEKMNLEYCGSWGQRGLKWLRNNFSKYKKEDVAAWLQNNTENIICKIISHFVKEKNENNICLAGGLFANVKINQRIKELDGIKNIYIYPAMSDVGIAHGAVLAVVKQKTNLSNVFLGPKYSGEEIKQVLDENNIEYKRVDNIEKTVAELLSQGNIVIRFNDKMEYGPRALGNRSILASAKNKDINNFLNKKLRRTKFMPFAPVILKEFANDYVKNLKGAEISSKFMTISFSVTEKMKKECPAAVHIDNTTRPQIIEKEDNESYYNILKEYHNLTGVPALINTSFNNHGEPIVMTPQDAVKSFNDSGLKYMAISNFLVKSKAK